MAPGRGKSSNSCLSEHLTLAEAIDSDLIICDLCHQVYLHPLLLPCLHTFCSHCVVTMVMKEPPPPLENTTAPSSGGGLQEQRAPGTTKGKKIVTEHTHLQCPTCQVNVTLAGGSANAVNDDVCDGHDDDEEDEEDDDEEDNETIKEQRLTMEEDEEISADGGPSKKQRQRTSGGKKDCVYPLISEAGGASSEHEEEGVPTTSASKDSQTTALENTRITQNPKQEDASTSHHHHDFQGGKQKQILSTAANQISVAKRLKAVKSAIQSSLPINHFLDSLARLYHHRNDAGRLCAYCKTEGESVDASCLCLQCQDNMCRECASAHRKTRLTREHRLAPFNSIGQGLFDHDIRSANGFVACPDHPESSVSYFCSDCLLVACKSCRSRSHYGHSLIPLADAEGRFLPEIKRIHQALTQSCPSLSKYAQFLSKQIEALTSARDTAMEDVNRQARIIIQMIEDRRSHSCSGLEEEYQREKAKLNIRIAHVHTSKHSTEKSASFLRHLANLGKADEQMSIYTHILTRRSELVASRPDMIRSKLSLHFYPGPAVSTNVAILLGKLEARHIPMESQERPKSYPLLSEMMPSTLAPPLLLTAISGSTGAATMYPSGLDVKDNMLAVVDRENQKVKIFDLTAKRLVKEFGGGKTVGKKQEIRFKRPFDVAFLPNGLLAISDPEAGCVWMYEWTGKFVATFKGDMKHPRGIAINKAGQVVVVDGHLRRLTVHDATTGEVLKVINPHPEEKSPDSSQSNDCPSGNDDQSNTIVQEQDGQSNQTMSKLPSSISSLTSPVLIDPFYVHVTNDGNLVVSDAASPNLKILDPDGLLLAETMDYGTGPDQNLHPSGVCVDKYGYILVADTNNNRIHLGLPDGQMTPTPLLSPADGLSHPVSLCLTKEGSLAVGESGGGIKLFKYVI